MSEPNGHRDWATGCRKARPIPAAEFPFHPARGGAYNNREYMLRRQASETAGWLQADRPRREVTTMAHSYD